MNHHLDDQGPDGFGSDELALRRMLQQAVSDIEPRDGSLDHLRKAVPARRARKRQAAVGMAAAALFVGTAVPALIHVSNSGGTDANPAIAGQASQAHGGTGEGKQPDGGSAGRADSGGPTGSQGGGSTKGGDEGKGDGGAAGTADGGGPSAPSSAEAPACAADQLGSATAAVQGADAAGTVYGSFRVTNVSAKSCAVDGGVALTTTPQGAADPAKISVTEHTSGDAAAALPDPSLYVSRLVLTPGSAYDVRFAWVPSETCPTNGGGDSGGSSSPSPSPTEPTGAANGGASTGASGTEGTSPQLFTEDGTADGSVAVAYTPDGGGPTLTATVPDACAGTVYRTGVLAPS
ncbi:hypothetical protein [Streptomyces longwoodensis]